MDKKYIKTGGETIAYLESGNQASADVLVLIHGNMSSSRHFKHILPLLPHDLRVITPDLRGMGHSSYNNTFDSLNELAQDIKALLDALHVEKAAFAGWSTGGGVCMELAADYPGLVSKVILIESVGCSGYPIPKKDANNQPINAFYESKEAMAADPVQVAPMIAAIAKKDAAFMTWVWDNSIYTVNKPTPGENAELMEATFMQRCLADIDWALMNFNITDRHNGVCPGTGKAARISCPVLVFWGDKDLIIPRYMTDEIISGIKDARLVTLENSGHSPIVDCPEVLAARMAEFLSA